MKKLFLIAILLANLHILEAKTPEKNKTPLIEKILIVQSQVDPKEIDSEETIVIQSQVPGEEKVLKEALALYLNQPITQQRMIDIKRTIIRYYRDYKYPMVMVEIPQQEITDGTVQFVVIEGFVESVTTTGNKWFSDRLIRDRVSININEPLNAEQLLNDVAWLNRNPFHDTNIVLSPGKKENSVDVELKTKDKFPLRVYVGGDNTGNKFTENARLYLGANWGNAFWHGDLLSYQYTSSFDFHRFQAHTGSYTLYLPWQNELILFGGYSRIHSKIHNFNSGGDSGQASIRYRIPFNPLYKSFTHTLSMGFDFKTMNNNLQFIGGDEPPVIDNSVNITQFMSEYEYVNIFGHHDLTFLVDVFWSPGKMVAKEKESDYTAYRPKAKSDYIYAFLMLEDIYRFSRWSFAGKLRLQAASRPLLPTEQFGLGGYSTVRGYDEREYNADNAMCFNFEMGYQPYKFRKSGADVILVAFIDYGLGNLIETKADEESTENLLGIGPGIRIRMSPYISVKVDYGFQLNHTKLGDHDIGKFNINAFISY